MLDGHRKYDEANWFYDRAIEIDPKNATFWNAKGWALFEAGKYNESLQAANKSLELNPNSTYAYDTKGAALSGMGRNIEALDSYNRSIELDPGKGRGIVWYHEGKAFEALGRTAQADAAFAKSAKMGFRG